MNDIFQYIIQYAIISTSLLSGIDTWHYSHRVLDSLNVHGQFHNAFNIVRFNILVYSRTYFFLCTANMLAVECLITLITAT